MIKGEILTRGELKGQISTHGKLTAKMSGPARVNVEPEKTATPSTTEQIVNPSEGFDALARVIVAPIPYQEVENDYGITVIIGGGNG